MNDYQMILDCIDPSLTDRRDWVRVGMALKEEGQPFEMFDEWSARDPRQKQYRGTEATRKVWDSFNGNGAGTVTGATLTQIARDQGHDPFYREPGTGFLDWDDTIQSDGKQPSYTRTVPVRVPGKGRQKEPFQIISYLEACFRPDDRVNIITQSFTDEEGKRKPWGAGLMAWTVQEYIDNLRQAADKPDFFDEVFGSYDHDTGVWIRINPVSGELLEGQKGVSDRNIVRFDNALIECDDLPIDDQIRLIKELELPYKALVFSGSRSVHAIVSVDAKSFADYKDRVTWLRQYCIDHGLPVDTQNVNPSRLSRLPGCDRGSQKQTLLETAKPVSFDDWRKSAVARDEALQLEVECMADLWDDMPPLEPELIHGVLRRGHKMLISGPSKAGKSFLLIQLMIAVAEGADWLGYHCEQGKVLYLNFEISRPSFLWRVKNEYKAKGLEPQNLKNITILNLRGKAEPLDVMTPKLEYLLKRGGYSLVIIDPIYKVITGDENSASDMGKFCNLFDRIGNAGGCAVAYCHHHSKGSQAQKSAIDRASGSGVFARDPDAIVDMTELEISDVDRKEIREGMQERVFDRLLKSTGQWANLSHTNPEILKDRVAKQELAAEHFRLFPDRKAAFEKELDAADSIGECDAYRVSMTLREFKSPDPVEVFFSYPAHVTDPTGHLKNMYLVGDNSIGSLNKKKEAVTSKRADEKTEWFKKKKEAGETVTIAQMTKHFGCTTNTIKAWAQKTDGVKTGNGYVLFEEEDTPPQRRKNSCQ